MSIVSKNLHLLIKLHSLAATIIISNPVYAVTSENITNTAKHPALKNQVKYSKSLDSFRSKINLSLVANKRLLAVPDDKFAKRLSDSVKDGRIEPIQLTVAEDDDQILQLATKISKPGKKVFLAGYLKENLSVSESIPGTPLRLVNLNPKSLEYVDRVELDELFAKDHSELTLKVGDLAKNPKRLNEFLSELRPYFSSSEVENIRAKILLGKDLSVDQNLLPAFAKKMITRHTIFKGPNCFHAALSFQNPSYPSSSLVNVREEAGYHRTMINYDEIWRIVQSDFYEVDTLKTPLQYGDMVLFFDAAKEPHVAVDFRTLRHAATYLFNGYIFEKGSKSANSPYVVRPLSDEWNTWTKYSQNLGAKVFRRNLHQIKKASLWESSDWMY